MAQVSRGGRVGDPTHQRHNWMCDKGGINMRHDERRIVTKPLRNVYKFQMKRESEQKHCNTHTITNTVVLSIVGEVKSPRKNKRTPKYTHLAVVSEGKKF
jgi:hypothetical protein